MPELNVGDVVVRVGKERRGEHTVVTVYRKYVVVRRTSNGKEVRVKTNTLKRVTPQVATPA